MATQRGIQVMATSRVAAVVSVTSIGVVLAGSLATAPVIAATPTPPMIVDSSGQPLSGAQITVLAMPTAKQIRRMPIGKSYSPKVALTVATDRDGVAPMNRLASISPKGNFDVLVNKQGFNQERRFLTGKQLSMVSTRAQLQDRNADPIVLTPDSVTSRSLGTRSSAPSYGRVIYTKLQERSSNVALGDLRSATPKGKASLVFSSSGSATIGVGIKLSYKGQASFSQQAERTISSGVSIPISPLLGVGSKRATTRGYFVRWKLSQTVVYWQGDKPIYRTNVWDEWRPEGLNGGDASTVSAAKPSTSGINKATRCSGTIRYGYGNTVSNGRATTIARGASLGGIVELTSQAGYSSNVAVKVGPRKKGQTVRVCGYSGAALSNPGSTVVIG
jgi:hypothetical protein